MNGSGREGCVKAKWQSRSRATREGFGRDGVG